MNSSMLWSALLLALAVGSVVTSPSGSELYDIIRRLEAAEAEITALKDNKEVQEKEITDMKSLVSQVREIYKNVSIFSAGDHQYLTSHLSHQTTTGNVNEYPTMHYFGIPRHAQ